MKQNDASLSDDHDQEEKDGEQVSQDPPIRSISAICYLAMGIGAAFLALNALSLVWPEAPRWLVGSATFLAFMAFVSGAIPGHLEGDVSVPLLPCNRGLDVNFAIAEFTGIWRIIGRTTSVFFRNLSVLLWLVCIVLLPAEAIKNILIYTLGVQDNFRLALTYDILVFGLVGSLLTPPVIFAVVFYLRERRVATTRDALRWGLGRWGATFAYRLLAACAAVGGLPLIIPGIVFFTWFTLTDAIVAVEQTEAKTLNRSRDLTAGYRWRILGAVVLLNVLIGFVGAWVVALLDTPGADSWYDQTVRDYVFCLLSPLPTILCLLMYLGILAEGRAWCPHCRRALHAEVGTTCTECGCVLPVQEPETAGPQFAGNSAASPATVAVDPRCPEDATVGRRSSLWPKIVGYGAVALVSLCLLVVLLIVFSWGPIVRAIQVDDLSIYRSKIVAADLDETSKNDLLETIDRLSVKAGEESLGLANWVEYDDTILSALEDNEINELDLLILMFEYAQMESEFDEKRQLP